MTPTSLTRNIFVGISLMGFASVAFAQTSTGRAVDTKQDPVVISVSWSSPDPRYLRLHQKEWGQLPFTGTAINLSWPRPEAGSVLMASAQNNASWEVYRSKPIAEDALRAARVDMAGFSNAAQRDNFLWVVSCLTEERYFDWFDDNRWETVLDNIERMSAVAHDSGMRGLILDMEEYGCALWHWVGSRPTYALSQTETYKGKTWEQVQAQVRSRGRTFMEAINRGFPGCPVWMTYAYSHTIYKYPDELQDLSQEDNALLVTFVDGMLEGADDETIIIDGCEPSYRASTRQEFEKLADVIRNKAIRYTAVPELYKQKVRVGFGIYLDMYHNHPWQGDQPQNNAQTPQRLYDAVRHALAVGDGYVWVYSEYPSWWLRDSDDTFADGVQARDDHKWIPSVYYDAIEKAISAAK